MIENLVSILDRKEIADETSDFMNPLPKVLADLFLIGRTRPNKEIIPGYTLLDCTEANRISRTCFEQYGSDIRIMPFLKNGKGSYFLYCRMYGTETIALYFNEEYIDLSIKPERFVELLVACISENAFYYEDSMLNFDYERLGKLLSAYI